MRLCSHQDEARGRQKDREATPSAEAGIIFVNWQALRGLPCLLGGALREEAQGAEQALSIVRKLLQGSRAWPKLSVRSPSGPTHRGGDTVRPACSLSPKVYWAWVSTAQLRTVGLLPFQMEKLSIWPQGSYRSPPRKNGVGDIAIVDE